MQILFYSVINFATARHNLRADLIDLGYYEKLLAFTALTVISAYKTIGFVKVRQKIAVGYFRASVKILAAVSPRRAAQRAFKIFCTPFSRSVKKTSPLFAKAEKLQLTIDNKNLVGYRWNRSQAKRFLILHGFQSCARNFERYIHPMVKKGYEVLAFDAPAHGESDGKQTNVLQYRNMIEEISNRYGPIDAFMGHSFGGLAVCLALENITHSKDTKLVLIAPQTETSTSALFLYKILDLDTETRREFEQLIKNTGGQPLEWYSVTRCLQNLHATILWFHDEDDDITPIEDIQPAIEANYSNIKFIITKGLGHRKIYHDPKVLNAITSFL